MMHTLWLLSWILPLRSSDLSTSCGSSEMPTSETRQGHALLQVHCSAKTLGGPRYFARNLRELNPSAATAPLTNDGYLAVADNCCQAEMKVFTKRQIASLNLQVCIESGLAGILPYHSCEQGPQSFDQLTSDLLADSTKDCTWLAKSTESCKARPAFCPDFGATLAASDCGCSRSGAARINLATADLVTNNLGGVGPNTADPEEMRFANAGKSSTGQTFDLVVTALTSGDKYSAMRRRVKSNRKSGGLASINIGVGINVNFLISIVLPGTNTPLILSEIHMAVFDIDRLESFSSRGYSGYTTDTNPLIQALHTPDGRTSFSAADTPAAQRRVTTATDPNKLSPRQRQHSVVFFYENVSSFEVTFADTGSSKKNNHRTMWFAFESVLNDRCGA